MAARRRVHPRRRARRRGGARGERRGGGPKLLTCRYRQDRNNALHAGAARIDHARGVALRQCRVVGIGRRGCGRRARRGASSLERTAARGDDNSGTKHRSTAPSPPHPTRARSPTHTRRSATPAPRWCWRVPRRRPWRRTRASAAARSLEAARSTSATRRVVLSATLARAARRRQRAATVSQRLGGREDGSPPSGASPCGFAWTRLLYKSTMSSFIGAVLRDTALS
jgi:hypothetical protein